MSGNHYVSLGRQKVTMKKNWACGDQWGIALLLLK